MTMTDDAGFEPMREAEASSEATPPAAPPRPRPSSVTRPAPDEGDEVLAAEVMDAIRTVRDPEIPVNLVDLGLIYDLMVPRTASPISR